MRSQLSYLNDDRYMNGLDDLQDLIFHIEINKLLMNHKTKKLPALFTSKSKTTFDKDRAKIEDLLAQNAKNRMTHKDYRYQQDYTQIKASNFVSRIEVVDSPKIICTVADHLTQLSTCPNKENQSVPAAASTKQSSLYRSEGPKMSEDRQQAINLAKWMQERLRMFRKKKQISFLDILDYKQTILNYSLGRLIDSLNKKCKEQGQLLSLIWNNTFTMFQGVFNILVEANNSKSKEQIKEEKELHELFEVNHQFLREENQKLQHENQEIFEKAKRIIQWNKRLRKDRKHLYTANRVLEYRNHSYSQALEQTVEMLLQTVPEPATIQTAKKIIQKLGKQKNRKRHFYKKEDDESFNKSTKQFVYNWLKRNGSIQEDSSSLLNELGINKEEQFMFQDLQDLSDMQKVNIYDFFKLYDVGVQATVDIRHDFTQCEVKSFRSAEVMTKNINTVDNGCQTLTKQDSRPSDFNNEKKYPQNTHSKQPSRLKNISRDNKRKKVREKDLVSNKSFKNIKKTQTAYVQEQKKIKNKFFQRSSNREYERNIKGEFMSRHIKEEDLANNTSVGFKFEEENQDGHSEKRYSNSFVSDLEEDHTNTKGPTTKHLITALSLGSRIKSLRDIPDYGSSKNLARLERGRNKKNSVAYIPDGIKQKSINKFNPKKRFADAYNENKNYMQENRDEFVDQIIRRRSFYGKKRVQFANFRAAEDATQKVKEYYRGKQWKGFNNRSMYEHSNYMTSHIEKLTKKISGASNMTKSKTLISTQTIITSIIGSVQQIARIPPNNKVFINNSITTIVKYIESLIPDYIRQVKRQKEELISDCEKVLYPLNILLMEQMTFKYGLKEIAWKKIKTFIEKVLTFSPVSEKVGLYSLLLGLQDSSVGSDQLLVYIKCLVYFECKKTIRDLSTMESASVDIEIVRQNLKRVLQYFFDQEYVNLLELKLEIYFQQTAPYSTVEGIALIIIKELLKRKKQLKLKYQKVHQLCSFGDNFFTNIYKMLKIVANYQEQAAIEAEKHFTYRKQTRQQRDSVHSIEALQKIKNRDYKRRKVERIPESVKHYDISKISTIIRELLQRSDIIDEEFGKSITLERFITAAVIYGMPTFNELETVLDFFKIKLNQLKEMYPIYNTIHQQNWRDLDRLANLWLKSSVQKSQQPASNTWSLAKVFSDKIEQEVVNVMGKIGTIGLYIESSLLNSSPSQ